MRLPLTHYKFAAFITGLVLVSVIYLVSVFSTVPYLQHEIIGYAHWWNDPNFGFFETLFDGVKLDGGPGRFRYVEYIAEAVYWKLMVAGFWPKDLYDYSGILAIFLIAFLLYRVAKLKGLTLFPTFLVLAFFLLSTNSLLISVFHFRKAKTLIALWFVLLYWASEEANREKKSPLALPLLSLIGFLGFFTDPFFVATTPVLIACLDFPKKNYERTRRVLLGMGVAFLALLLINGVIGPQFNRNTKLMFYGFTLQGSPELLSLKNVPAFSRVLQELIAPGYITEPTWSAVRELETPGGVTETAWVGWLSVLSLIVLIVLQKKKGFSGWGAALGLLLVLPICSFLLIPISVRSSYSGYYGFPFLIVLCIVLMNLFLFLKENFSKEIQICGFLSALILISFHQSHGQAVYRRWVEHSVFPIKRELYDKDYVRFREVAKFFRENVEGEYVFKLTNTKISVGRGLGYYARPGLDGTDLLFDVIPLVFRSEVDKGRLKFMPDGKNKIPPPGHLWFSYALRFPHYLDPIPKGTMVDVFWRTAEADNCLVYPFGSRELNGGIKLRLDETTTFRIQCDGPGGRLEDSFTAEVM